MLKWREANYKTAARLSVTSGRAVGLIGIGRSEDAEIFFRYAGDINKLGYQIRDKK